MNLFTIIIFLVVLAVLILVHELGHFLFAKLFGVRVDAFALGFGPQLASWKRGDTTYAINWIPFGGYVKIFGENPDDESIGGVNAPHSFIHKARWKQAIVFGAGILFNFLFAWVLYTGVFMTGVTAATDGFQQYAADFSDQRVMVTFVEPGSPADKAGIQIGDVIDQIAPASGQALKSSDGSLTVAAIPDAIDADGNSPLTFEYSRPSGQTSVQVVPQLGLVTGKYAIGIGMDDVADLRLPVVASLREGFSYTISMISQTVVGLYGFVVGLFRGTANFSEVSGPVGIAGIIGNAAELGPTFLIMITALISVNLGVVNLIPFPALDGGRILLVVLESIFRRRIPTKVNNAVNGVGFIILMTLMVVVTYQDIAKLLVK